VSGGLAALRMALVIKSLEIWIVEINKKYG